MSDFVTKYSTELVRFCDLVWGLIARIIEQNLPPKNVLI